MKFLIILSVALACQAAVLDQAKDATAEVLKQTYEPKSDGSYSQKFETSNNIAIESSGVLKKVAGAEEPALEVKGNIKFISPDGANMELTYIANENGYQPSAAHIPTPPPVPAAIQRSLEWIASQPKYVEKKY